MQARALESAPIPNELRVGAQGHNRTLGASPKNQKLQFREQTSIGARIAESQIER